GDEQSIEQSLSTFSAHITNIRRILDEADEKSLVLIDELGAGTDPVEGAALATAILEKLRQQGAKIASTTHYAELKSFALDTKGVENACCEFDVATLRPTYKLLIGMPGRSNAFAISERLGIRSEVVERAKELVSHENTQFESVVQKLEESRHELEQRIAEADALKAEIKAERERMAAAEEEARQKQEKELENARLQAENIITKARAQVYGVLDEIEAIRRKKDVTAEEKAKLKADIRQMEDAADPIHAREQEEYHLPRPLKAGDNVLIFDIDKKAVVLETGKDSVLVQAGIIKTRVPLNNLRLLKEERVTTPKRSVTRTIRSDVKRTASTEVDVRGEVVLDALMDVDRAIDSAVMQGLHQITIIHGKGTGVLRKEIQAHLKKHPSVRSFRLGVFGEGDAGVTIAELK
ncbi:MAG TPA: endonuclease MutS2, partial [Ruminococcaceae bacterium]|nr:endonuclease MutS2 [Oscillospiraceae bacterium]